ncbi:Retrovirus-related Pol polyprotein from transposon TNT 1-94 [Bienertia sinuspersici]
MSETPKLHPATTVTNIKALIPVTLDYAGTHYNNWATLFKLHCRAHLVLGHIMKPASKSAGDATTKSEEEQYAALVPWQRLDDIVHQWIYGTVSNDLLNTILNPDDSAMDTWERWERLFRGNQSARALQYDTQLSNIKLEQFTGVKEYCTRIKTLANNLHNVGSSITDDHMVLRLLRGLGDDPNYKLLRTLIQQMKPLPDFETVRTMLELEEISNTDDNPASSEVALVTHDSGSPPMTSDQPRSSNMNAASNSTRNTRDKNSNRNSSRGGGGHNNNRRGGRAGRGGRGGQSGGRGQ